ncbi:MAG TPA: DUF4260 domain-containing protein [Candidatus Saccharimonadales bacterium]
MQSKLMKRVVSTEYLVAAVLVAVFYVVVGNFAWYWLPVLFIVVDFSAIGYFFNNRMGALVYNIAHSLIGPAALVLLYIGTTNQVVLFIALVWLFHIFVDRALGYGLKHVTGFHHTHLGTIGKATKK